MNAGLLLLSAAPIAVNPFLRLELDTVFSEAQVDEGDEDIDASAIVGEVTAGIKFKSGNTAVEFAGQSEYIEFSDPGFTDRWRHYGRVTVDHDFDPQWNLRARAGKSLRFPSAEYFDIDETEFGLRLRYQPVRAHRFGSSLVWRERSYNDPENSQGSGPRIEGDYRYRFGRYHYLAIDARHEEISSDDPARRYDRQAVAVTYTHPLTDELRIRPKIAYRETAFSGRILQSGEIRTDRQYTPEIEVLWWPDDWRTSAELQYRKRDSNDPERRLSGLRAQVTIARVF